MDGKISLEVSKQKFTKHVGHVGIRSGQILEMIDTVRTVKKPISGNCQARVLVLVIVLDYSLRLVSIPV